MSNNPISHLSAQKRLNWVLKIGIIYVCFVITGGLLSKSLSLLADASHMIVHSAAIAIAIIASHIATREKNKGFSDKYRKIESIGGYTNGLLLIIISIVIAYEAITRLIGFGDMESHHNHEIDASIMGITALFGLFFHILSAVILYGGRNESLNVYALFLHSFFDILSTIIALITSILIHFLHIDWLDSVSSLLIASLIIFGSFKMLKRGYFEIVNEEKIDINVKDIETSLNKIPHIKDIHHIILRVESDESISMSAHIVMKDECLDKEHWQDCKSDIEALLQKEFNIKQTVLQLEF